VLEGMCVTLILPTARSVSDIKCTTPEPLVVSGSKIYYLLEYKWKESLGEGTIHKKPF
jgi:hypothetical protein